MRSFRHFGLAAVALLPIAAAFVALGQPAAAATADPSSIAFGPFPVNGGIAQQRLTVTPDPGYRFVQTDNDTSGSGSAFSAQFDFSGQPDACGAFGVNGTCFYDVWFAPHAVGDLSGKVGVGECPIGTVDNCIILTIPATGTGIPASTSGTLTATDAVPGGQVRARSVTPCPSGEGNPSATVSLVDGSGTTVITSTPTFTDAALDWTTDLTAPTQSGEYTIVATCANYGATVQTYQPMPVTVGATSTVVTAAPDPVDFGQPITLSATAAFTAAGLPPTGTVIFTDGAATLGITTLVNGVAQLSASGLTLGTHHVIATYSGNGLGSAGDTDVTVQQAPTTLRAAPAHKGRVTTVFSAVLTSDGSPVAGQPIAFTARNLLGRVVVQCTASTNTLGVASCSTSNLGRLLLSATYRASFAGTPEYRASTATAALTV